MSQLYGPDGQQLRQPTPAEAHAGALQAQLELGTLALRCLSILISEMPGQKTTIRSDRLARLVRKYPNAHLRFSRDGAGGVHLALMTPEQMDGADQSIADVAKERREQLEAIVEDGLTGTGTSTSAIQETLDDQDAEADGA